MKQAARLSRIGGLLSLFALAGCSEEVRSDPSREEAPEPRMRLDAPAPDPILNDSYSTYLYSERDADVFSRMPENETAGRALPVVAIHVETGDRVQAGDLLATLDDEMAALELEAIRPRVEESRTRLARARVLSESGVVTPTELEEAEFENRRSEAALRQAELYLSRTRVLAPFAGVVARRYVRVGEMVSEEEPLFRITALAPLRARLLVPEDRSGRFELDAPVLLAGVNGETTTARVVIVGPTVDPASGTREVIVEIVEANGFRPGAAVTAAPLPVATERTK